MDRLVRAVEGRTEDGYHADGVLVAELHCLLAVHVETVPLHRHVAGLDLEVVAELLPADLDVYAHDHVRPICALSGYTPSLLPAAFEASPPSMAASLEPVVEQPVATSVLGEFHRRLSMLTQRISSSAVCGYSSLSIMFLSRHSAISFSACGSIHVVTNVARFKRAFPSNISSSCTI